MEAWWVYYRHRVARRKEEGKARYLGSSNAMMRLPAYLGVYTALFLLLGGWEYAADFFIPLLLSICWLISGYYLLLLVLLPLLRRRFSAVACAELWLLPNILYLLVQAQMHSTATLLYWSSAPVVVLPWLRGDMATAIWAVGMAAVLGWKIVAHILFRRRILKDAREEDDPAVLDLWYAEQRAAGHSEADLPLVRSPHISTPLSIGLFPGTLKVVLPEQSYAPEELALILRHELIHIGRQDNVGKFFLAFCTAMCWFNPLVWMAMGRSAEDMELSCDETVLLDGDDAARRRYSELILSTAGDERGFTTCLSASAKSLRYRLSRVMRPQKRLPGALLVGVMVALLLAACGSCLVAYDRVVWSEAVADGTVTEVRLRTEGSLREQEVAPALTAYLESLTLCRTTSAALPYGTEKELLLMCLDPFGWVAFSGDLVEVQSAQWLGNRVYYCPGGIDWGYIHSLYQQP